MPPSELDDIVSSGIGLYARYGTEGTGEAVVVRARLTWRASRDGHDGSEGGGASLDVGLGGA